MKNEFKICGDYTIIYLKRKNGDIIETVISTADLERVQEFSNTWCAAWQEHVKNFYVYGWLNLGNGKQTTVKLHRWIMNPSPSEVVDHQNKNTLDNQRHNLKCVTNATNMQNVSAYKTSKTGIRGVSWSKSAKKWKAKFVVHGKTIYCKYFDDLDEASQEIERIRSIHV